MEQLKSKLKIGTILKDRTLIAFPTCRKPRGRQEGETGGLSDVSEKRAPLHAFGDHAVEGVDPVSGALIAASEEIHEGRDKISEDAEREREKAG